VDKHSRFVAFCRDYQNQAARKGFGFRCCPNGHGMVRHPG